MSTNRQSLGAYPCPIGIDTWCNEGCAEAIDNCEAVTCLWLPVYRQAMADQKCARVLLALKRWWWDRHYWADIFVGVKGDPGSMRIARFRKLMEGRLRAAGLE